MYHVLDREWTHRGTFHTDAAPKSTTCRATAQRSKKRENLNFVIPIQPASPLRCLLKMAVASVSMVLPLSRAIGMEGRICDNFCLASASLDGFVSQLSRVSGANARPTDASTSDHIVRQSARMPSPLCIPTYLVVGRRTKMIWRSNPSQRGTLGRLPNVVGAVPKPPTHTSFSSIHISLFVSPLACDPTG